LFACHTRHRIDWLSMWTGNGIVKCDISLRSLRTFDVMFSFINFSRREWWVCINIRCALAPAVSWCSYGEDFCEDRVIGMTVELLCVMTCALFITVGRFHHVLSFNLNLFIQMSKNLNQKYSQRWIKFEQKNLRVYMTSFIKISKNSFGCQARISAYCFYDAEVV
jgi:hypothetical protein